MLRRVEYKYLVGIVFVFGLFMDLLDMTITNVALPTLARHFSARTTTIEWVVTAYLLSLAIFIPISGWAGDRFGTKRVFMFALSMFTLSSFLCAISWNIGALITFRLLQGVGGGMLTPVGTAMLFRAFPPSERAKASALLAIPAVVAPATGPVLGGYLVEYQSWHWIFLINVPIGLTGLIVAALALRESKEEHPGHLDVPGFIFGSFGLASMVYALAEAGDHGFNNPRVMAYGLGGLALLAVFTLLELRTAEPMIDMRLMKNRLFASANAVQLVSMAGLQGALFLLPLFLQFERGMSPLASGLTTFPQAIGVMLIVQPAQHLYRRIGPQRMMVAGMIGATVTTFAFLAIGIETSAWWIRLIMLARGVSFGVTLVPLQAATFATIRSQDTGRASAIFNSGRQVASSFGVALIATALTNRMTHHAAQMGNPATRGAAVLAFHDAFFVAGVLAIVGVLVAFVVRDRDAISTMAVGAPEGAVAEAPVAMH